MKQLVIIRHGESEWNKQNRFTGWTDVDLSDKGREEAVAAGKLLKQEGFAFDVCYTSYLRRAIHTADLVLDAMDEAWIPVCKTWRLNERHYGALQGLYKAETAAKYGEDLVHVWRRSFDVRPPALEPDDKRCADRDRRYRNTPAAGHPLTESLKDTVARAVPYYESVISRDIAAGKRVLIAAHGNSIRALVKYLDGIGDQEIVGINIPTGVPLVYELDDDLRAVSKRYLGDQAAIAAKEQAVRNQGKKQ